MTTYNSIATSFGSRIAASWVIAFLACSAHFAFAESLIPPVMITAEGYCCDQPPVNAIDNEPDTAWNSGGFPPASIVLDMGNVYALSHIELLTAQYPEGITEHQIWLSNDQVSWTNAYVLRSNTIDGQWLSLPVNLSGRYISIMTVLSPSWVAWREIRVFQRSESSSTYGFWDQGFNDPKIRTNYSSPYEGTRTDPLTIASCLFDGCPSYPDTYIASNASASNLSSFSESQYWTLLLNNEPSYNNGCNSGPPDASLPQSFPGSGIFGFAPIMDRAAGENFYRAHLVLNSNFANPCFEGIPYMSIGAHSNRGNVDADGESKVVGALNAAPGIPHTVSFTTRLYEYEPMHAALYRLVVAATWPDAQGRELPRMIQLNLFHEGDEDSSSSGPASLRWSWPIAEDTFFPGAEIAYFDSEDVQTLCPGDYVYRMTASDRNTDLDYDIDLQPLYECAARWKAWSNSMPATANIPIVSVDWVVEGQGSGGALWAAVHNMRMH